jgi:enoyl-[acyl-carrier protein] reductase III
VETSTLGLDGRSALITGGTRGLGLAIARKLCASGCHVYVNYNHSEPDAQQALRELSEMKGTATLLRADVAQPNVVPELLERIAQDHPRLDILVHNAATLHPMPATKPHIGDFWDDVRLAINPLVQAAPRLADAMEGGGRVVAVSSSGARSVIPGYVSQGVGKAAVESLVRYLACELAPGGVTVNAVSTGKIDMGEDTRGAELVPTLAARTPAGRLTRPEDVAGVVALLCTDEAAWIQGQVITADGGLGLRA